MLLSVTLVPVLSGAVTVSEWISIGSAGDAGDAAGIGSCVSRSLAGDSLFCCFAWGSLVSISG